MADPLSIAASVAGLITISSQLIVIIGNIRTKNNKELEDLSKEIHGMRSTLSQIQNLIQFQATRETKNEEWLDALNRTLCECGDTLLGLKKTTSSLVSSSKLESFKNKVKWAVKEKEIADAFRRLESYKVSLDLLLSIQTSSTTTNIEDMLKEVHLKVSSTPRLEPAVRPPLSWRQKLGGFQLKEPDTNASENADGGSLKDGASTLVGEAIENKEEKENATWIIDGPGTKGWDQLGVHGLDRDEGHNAPELNSPNLVTLCEISVGNQSIGLLYDSEGTGGTTNLTPMHAHILVKGPNRGDVFYLELNQRLASLGHSNRFAVPVGKASLILGKISKRNTAALRDSIETLPERAEYRLALDEMAIRSAGDYLQALVNFNNHHDRELFLVRLYALRYVQRMETIFSHPTMIYHVANYSAGVQLVQVGRADGTEKSYIYPNLFVLENFESRPHKLACTTKISIGGMSATENPYFFREDITKFEIELVGHEAVTFTAPGDDIQTVAASFGTPDDIVRFYYSLKDTIDEWTFLSQEDLTAYKQVGEWDIPKISTDYSSSAFHNTHVIASADRFLKRLKFEVFKKGEDTKLALAYCDLTSVLFIQGMGDFFLEEGPVFNCSIRDFKQGDTETSDPRSSQMTLRVKKGHPARKEVPEIVNMCLNGSEKAKVEFIKGMKVGAA